MRPPVFPGVGEGPALRAESGGALDLLSLTHNQFHFGETIQKWVGQIRSNLKYFYKVVFAAQGSFWNANPQVYTNLECLRKSDWKGEQVEVRVSARMSLRSDPPL